MAAVRRQMPKPIRPVSAPQLPDEAHRLWRAFADLDDSRGEGFSGPAPITYEEIVMRGIALDEKLEPWEVRAIRRLDRVRRHGDQSGGASNG